MYTQNIFFWFKIGKIKFQHLSKIVALNALFISVMTTFTLNAQEVKNSLSLYVDQTKIIRLSEKVSEVFIANPEIADVHLSQSKNVYVIGKKAGTTSLIVSNAEGKVLLEKAIRVQLDYDQLRSLLKENLKDEKITLHQTAVGLILQGTVSSIEALDTALKITKSFASEKSNIVNNLTVSSPLQINLKVKIIEISRKIKNSLGINWDATLKSGNFAVGTFTGTAFANPAWFKGAGLLSSQPFALTGMTGNNLALKVQAPQGTLNTLLSALESEGLLTTLAEPNLTAISGQSATFLSGGELGILMPASVGSPPSVEYKPYGISLEFKPTVLNKGRINIHVKPEVSTPDYSNAVTVSNGTTTTVIPNILTRRAETVVELGSGESFVIAGLLYNDLANTVNEVAGLAKVPVLGALFRNTSADRTDTEVMIVVTPYIVKPINGQPIATPIDGLKYSNLGDMFFKGTTIESDAALENNKLAGDAGFAIEEA